MVNALSHEIPIGATDFAYVYTDEDQVEKGKEVLADLIASTHREIVGDIIRGPGWTPEQIVLFAYTKPLPEAAEAVRAHVEAPQGVSSD